MMSNNQILKCGLNRDIVSYMYDELSPVERTAFEAHLIGCTACTDEFAEIAHARFSVYEWHAKEFVPLASPVIEIPYPQRAEALSGAGFVAGVRELFALGRWPATVAAMLTIAAGAGLVAILFSSDGEQQRIAANLVEPAAIVKDAPQNLQTVSLTPKPEVKVNTVNSQPIRSEVRSPMRVVEKRRTSPRHEITAEASIPTAANIIRPDRTTARRTSRAPVLSSFEDNDDRSLRLADLVDDGGSRR